ncbi:NCK1 [Mytilus edulis]|uniref:NCK1 n=1 Tax=Mytilus edulis TaxID=6550 RepID=A0A8S3STE6_MYTED|nr:NCK1 [Mytilus edulis]
MQAQNKFAVMLWPTESGKMSVHSLGKIKEPLKPWKDFKLGDKGKASYPGYKELWDFEILAIGYVRGAVSDSVSDALTKHCFDMDMGEIRNLIGAVLCPPNKMKGSMKNFFDNPENCPQWWKDTSVPFASLNHPKSSIAGREWDSLPMAYRYCSRFSLDPIVNVVSANLSHVNIHPGPTNEDGETGEIDHFHEQEIDAEPVMSQPVWIWNRKAKDRKGGVPPAYSKKKAAIYANSLKPDKYFRRKKANCYISPNLHGDYYINHKMFHSYIWSGILNIQYERSHVDQVSQTAGIVNPLNTLGTDMLLCIIEGSRHAKDESCFII